MSKNPIPPQRSFYRVLWLPCFFLWLASGWFALGWVAACSVAAPSSEEIPTEQAQRENISTDRRCAGSEAYCARRYDEMIFVMAHNAMSTAEEKWDLPLQNWSLTRQMEEGVRGLMLDTYEKEGELLLCHSFCELGKKPLREGLLEIQRFLEANPREIITIEFEDHASAEKTVAIFRDIGLDKLAHTQAKDAAWPTLGEMIAQNKRLVVLADNQGGKVADAPWYHYTWELAWDNPYAAKSEEDFVCRVGRGQSENKIFILNHFLTAPLGLPSLAEKANTRDSLQGHIERCQKETGRLPNFVAVDFVDLGDVFSVVEFFREPR